jgi:dCTP deaminase
MILSADTIRKLLNRHDLAVEDRLIITPILDWDNQLKQGTASVDLRLGQTFRVPKRTKIDHIDYLDPLHSERVLNHREEYHILLGDYFVLHPRQFILGETIEWVYLPRDLSAQVVGKSSMGRDGLIIETAPGVHPGYSGILTLEITNLGEIPIRLYPGMKIAQLFIYEVRAEPGIRPVRSSFAGSVAPASAGAAKDDIKKISKLSKAREDSADWISKKGLGR